MYSISGVTMPRRAKCIWLWLPPRRAAIHFERSLGRPRSRSMRTAGSV
jgi:hypothetical protein